MATTIGELARATGTKVETVRYYERIGLLPAPPRTGGNYRSYGAAELARLSFIRRARDLGFSVEQVRALLGLSDDKQGDCARIDAIAQTHRAEVERKLADLTALRAEGGDHFLQGRRRRRLSDHRGAGTSARIVRHPPAAAHEVLHGARPSRSPGLPLRTRTRCSAGARSCVRRRLPRSRSDKRSAA